MKSVIAFLIFGFLSVPLAARENQRDGSTPDIAISSQRQHPGNGEIRSSRISTKAESPDGDAYPPEPLDHHEGTIIVDVWSRATAVTESSKAEPGELSPDFAVAALQVAFRMQTTERKLENSIRQGFPVGEFWIRNDIEGIDDSLILAALSARNDIDREALRQLRVQSGRLRLWSDWLIDANQKMELGNYLTSSGALDNDERFQNTVVCTKHLISMLAAGNLDEDVPCR